MLRRVSLVLFAIFLASCSKGLDRDAAKKLIQANAVFSMPVSKVTMGHTALKLAHQEGILKEVFPSPRVYDRHWEPSGEGKKYFTGMTSGGMTWASFTLANPLHREVVEVTGITEGSGGSQKLVRFTWRYRDLSDTIVRYTGLRRDHHATAFFRMYDDGWRIDDFSGLFK